MTASPATVPRDLAAPSFKRFGSPAGAHVLIVPHSRIFDLPAELAERFDAGAPDALGLAEALGATALGEDPLDLVPEPAPQSVSLNVSSACNLSCAYCYADRGSFEGAQPRPMSRDVARAAVDRLLTDADPAQPVTVGFLGGEPFVSRALIYDVVRYAAGQGARRGLDVRFSVTTNATLLTPDDLALLRAHPFAVTVSIDGGAAVHDRQRPRHDQGGSFAALCARIAPLLSEPGHAKICARATVMRTDLDLEARFDAIRAVGFRDIGFAPLRAPAGAGVLRDDDWPAYLAALQQLARRELDAARDGAPIAFGNLAIALKQIHRGASAPYPCGAGGGYFSVSADGRWYACHRAVGSPDYEMGSSRGLDAVTRRRFLAHRHVDAQADCARCWARYLCSGGCHQEAAARTAASCDVIRGWLEFCLAAYCELTERRPDYFAVPHLSAEFAA
jgi:uncharacterized protein